MTRSLLEGAKSTSDTRRSRPTYRRYRPNGAYRRRLVALVLGVLAVLVGTSGVVVWLATRTTAESTLERFAAAWSSGDETAAARSWKSQRRSGARPGACG